MKVFDMYLQIMRLIQGFRRQNKKGGGHLI